MAAVNHILISAYVTPEQKKKLAKLSKVTRVPQQVYIREAIDMVLKEYRKQLK